MKRWTTGLLALAAIGLAGCGLRGGLETPPPLWGDPPAMTDAEYEDAVAEPDEEEDEDF